jgi:hypothetical protein
LDADDPGSVDRLLAAFGEFGEAVNEMVAARHGDGDGEKQTVKPRNPRHHPPKTQPQAHEDAQDAPE